MDTDYPENNKRYKRKSVKRSIECHICGASTQWATRHLSQVHDLHGEQALDQLRLLPWYRSRNKAGAPKPKFCCTQLGCKEIIFNVRAHLIRKHKMNETSICDNDLNAEEVMIVESINAPLTTSEGPDQPISGGYASRCTRKCVPNNVNSLQSSSEDEDSGNKKETHFGRKIQKITKNYPKSHKPL